MSSADKGSILKAIRAAYPKARVVWQGDVKRPTIWVTTEDFDRCVILDLEMPELSLEALMENILDVLNAH